MPDESILDAPELSSILTSIKKRPFHIHDFIAAYRLHFPERWSDLEARYGLGGRGSGDIYSAVTRLAHMLGSFSKLGRLSKVGYRDAPAELNFGYPKIMYWSDGVEERLFPDEIHDNEVFYEGAKSRILVNQYERDRTARLKCIEHFGMRCQVCDIDFSTAYGALGLDFIHVHHIIPLSQVTSRYVVNPVRDLVPVCPNCHAMLHRGHEVLTIAALKKIIQTTGYFRRTDAKYLKSRRS